MKRLLPLLLCLSVLLSGCARECAAPAPQKEASASLPLSSRFPPSYDLTFRLEAFQGEFPNMSDQALAEKYPGLAQSMAQVLHGTDERVSELTK